MDSHTRRTLDRLEIVETGRRRRWTEDDKVRIVLESMAGPRLVAPTARRHNISRSMLVLWRRTFKAAASGESRPAFVQAVVAAPTYSPIAAAAQLSEGGHARAFWKKGTCPGRFLWSSVADGVVTITQAQLGYLLEGDRLAPFAENLAAARRRLKDCWGQRGWRLPCGKQR